MTTQRGELPGLEMACLAILWEGGEQTVHQVRDRLRPTRPLAYTTVMTVLDRLEHKGAVTRRKQGRAFRYRAEYAREESLNHALDRLAALYFGGSRIQLAEYFSGQPAAAPAPLQPAPSRPAHRLDETLL